MQLTPPSRDLDRYRLRIGRRSGGYVEAARACGLDQAGGEGQLGDELLCRVAERVRPHRAAGFWHGTRSNRR
jgi:hypothetical protein